MIDRRVWLSGRAIGLHVVILIVVPTFAALCDWQVHRAIAGNSLSWAYVFEWPFFAGYAIYMWWRFVHETANPVEVDGAPGPTRTTGAASEPEDEELTAYNHYLAQLAEQDQPKRWRS